EADALNAALDALSAGRMQPVMTTPAPRGSAHRLEADSTTRSPGQQDVTFLEGDPAALKGLRSLKPIIVLTPEAQQALIAKFGAFYPRHIQLFLDASGDHCFVEWSDGWRGGQLEGTRVDGSWQLKIISEWIS